MIVTNEDREIVKLLLKKLEKVNIIVNIMTTPNGDKEIRAYAPNGKSIGELTLNIANSNDLIGDSKTNLLTIDVHKLIKNQHIKERSC